MQQSCNPYEPPRDRSRSDSEKTTKVSSASVFWFLGAAFLGNLVGLISQPTAQAQPFPWTLRTVAGVSLLSAVVAMVALLIYGFVGIIFTRSCPATRISRTMAGVVFSSIMCLVGMLLIVVGFKGPPGVMTLPVAAIASTFVDRYLARIARTVTELADARETSASSVVNGESTPQSP